MGVMQETLPAQWWRDATSPTDEKNWRIVAKEGGFFLQAWDDALLVSADVMQVTRTGTTIDSVAFTATTMTLNGLDMLDASNIYYDNSVSGFETDNVQGAIDACMQHAGPTMAGYWRFDDVILPAYPGNGQLRYNSTTPASVTELYISQTSNPGTDTTRILSMLANGMRILVQQQNDSNRFIVFEVTGAATDNGTWWTVPGTVSSSGTLPADGTMCNVVMFGAAAAGITEHSDLTGLGDDDHLQYLTDARGDARYALIEQGLPAGGTSGQLLAKVTAADYDAEWIDAPEDTIEVTSGGAEVSRTTNLAVSGWTDVAFTTEDRDEGGYWDVANPDRFTATEAGWYAISASVTWDAAFYAQGLFIYKNGTTYPTDEVAGNFHAAYASMNHCVSFVGYLNAGDYLKVRVYSASAVNLACATIPARAAFHRLATTNDGAAVSRTTNLTSPVSTMTNLAFTTEDRDDSSYWAVGNPERFTIPTTGWYIVSGYVRWSDSTRPHGFILYKNGTAVANQIAGGMQNYHDNARQNLTYVGYLTAGDTLTFRIFTEYSDGTLATARAEIHRLDLTGSDGAEITITANQSINNFASVAFNTEVRDDGGYWSASNPERFTITNTGWYAVTLSLFWNAVDGVDRGAYIFKNGTSSVVSSLYHYGTSDGPSRLSVSYIGYLTAGDYLVFQARNKGTTSTLPAATVPSRAAIHRLEDTTITYSSLLSDIVWEAKGDLLAGTGPDTAAILPVGTDAQVLAADSTQVTGLRWVAAPDTSAFVLKAGDTMTGDLSIVRGSPGVGTASALNVTALGWGTAKVNLDSAEDEAQVNLSSKWGSGFNATTDDGHSYLELYGDSGAFVEFKVASAVGEEQWMLEAGSSGSLDLTMSSGLTFQNFALQFARTGGTLTNITFGHAGLGTYTFPATGDMMVGGNIYEGGTALTAKYGRLALGNSWAGQQNFNNYYHTFNATGNLSGIVIMGNSAAVGKPQKFGLVNSATAPDTVDLMLSGDGTQFGLISNVGSSPTWCLSINPTTHDVSVPANLAVGGTISEGGTLLSDKYAAGPVTTTGNRWGCLPAVGADGVMEVGKYIDFHDTDADATDYSVRLTSSTTALDSSLPVTVGGVELGFRQIPRSTTTTTAAVTDNGKCIAASAGITIPNAVFSAGMAVSIYNDSGSSITITQGASLTLRLVGTATTGNRTLAQRGYATIWFNTASEAVISGGGLT